MKCISWNVNGIRACLTKGFMDYFKSSDADFICLQETKVQRGQVELELPGYYQYWNYAEKKGYSGTAVFCKKKPMNVLYGLSNSFNDLEGRLITLEYEKFYLVTCYTPNSQDGLKRIEFRMEWDDEFRKFLCNLKKQKAVLVCGDLNVAHREIDLKNPTANVHNAGFSPQEREKFQQLLDSGFIDTYRMLYPNLAGQYSWWSYRFNARQRNAGWRIDYWLVSNDCSEFVVESKIRNDVFGSDHCPIELVISDFGG